MLARARKPKLSARPRRLLIALIVLKTGATAISLGCGFGGGVFSPSLVIGAMLGGAYGIIATEAFPHLSWARRSRPS